MDKLAKTKIIVVFADIRGSSRWTRRMADDESTRHSFMMAYDKECKFYKKRTNCGFYKRLGDGRMFVHELPERNYSKFTSNVLLECLGLIRRVDRIISKLPTPRPTGFRVRLFAGIVNKEIYDDSEQDWVGYIPNSCHKLLAVAPEISCLMQESVMELIGRKDQKKNRFMFTLLTGERLHPDGVDREDIDSLWTVAKRAS